MIEEIETAIAVVAHGLNDLALDQRVSLEEKLSMTRSNVSCYNNSPLPWRGGALMRSDSGSLSLFLLFTLLGTIYFVKTSLTK